MSNQQQGNVPYTDGANVGNPGGTAARLYIDPVTGDLNAKTATGVIIALGGARFSPNQAKIDPGTAKVLVGNALAYTADPLQYIGTSKQNPAVNGDKRENKFSLQAGIYDFHILGIKDITSGIVKFLLDGVNIGTVDMVSPFGTRDLNQLTVIPGVNVLETGNHTLTYEIVGKNAAATGFEFEPASIWFAG